MNNKLQRIVFLNFKKILEEGQNLLTRSERDYFGQRL